MSLKEEASARISRVPVSGARMEKFPWAMALADNSIWVRGRVSCRASHKNRITASTVAAREAIRTGMSVRRKLVLMVWAAVWMTTAPITRPSCFQGIATVNMVPLSVRVVISTS